MTIDALIQDCVQLALGLPRSPIQTDVYNAALAAVNSEGQKIWDAWPWDNTKLDEFETPTPVADAFGDGVITFAANVDTIRALRTITDTSDGSGTRIFNQNDIQAAELGETISSTKFIYLADDASGCRRIKVNDSTGTYRALATFRFTPYTTGTALTDSYPIDRAEQALRSFVCDALRIWGGEQVVGDGPSLLALAHDKENEVADRDFQMTPRSPMFEDVGNWW